MPDPAPTATTTVTVSPPHEVTGAVTTTTTTTVKKWWKTSEAWFAGFVATLISVGYATGAVTATGDRWQDHAAALVALGLTSLGYSIARGNAKSAG